MSTQPDKAALALTKRNAAFEKAKYALGRECADAASRYTVKERSRSPLLGDMYLQACERARVNYHAARAYAQAAYLKATAPTAAPNIIEEWEAGLDD